MRNLIAIVLVFIGICGSIAALSNEPSGSNPVSLGERIGILAMAGSFFAIGFYLFFSPIYNRLRSVQNKTEMAFSNIDVLLQRRHDVLDNLMAIAMRYVSHESNLLASIASHRSNSGSDGVEGRMQEAQTQYGSRLLAVVEAYPELKADNGFARLTDQLDKTEKSPKCNCDPILTNFVCILTVRFLVY